MMQNLAVPVSECWLKHKQYHMRTGRMMMDPKFAKLLAEHTLCLRSDNQALTELPEAHVLPGDSLPSMSRMLRFFCSLLDKVGSEKKGQDIRDPMKKLMWYTVNTRTLHLSVHCHHLCQLLTNAAQPVQP